MSARPASARPGPLPATGPLLGLRGISKRFGGLQAISGVDLAVERGELRCLIGPNGAGKSTLFKLIMGTHPVSGGSITLNGRDITRLPTWMRARLGLSIKMQIPGVYGELTVRDNLRIAAQQHVAPHTVAEEIDHLLGLAGLSALGNPTVKHLSHGQQQWLEIAMALAARPDVLLLDEPAAGMGPEETRITADLVRTVHAAGTTVLVIEHDMEFVRMIARKVTVLHYGRVFAEGTLADIEANEDVVRIYLGKV